jgi:hypothetical protein
VKLEAPLDGPAVLLLLLLLLLLLTGCWSCKPPLHALMSGETGTCVSVNVSNG